MGRPVGSQVVRQGRPACSRRWAKSLIWVDFPLPSMPSRAKKCPRVSFIIIPPKGLRPRLFHKQNVGIDPLHTLIREAIIQKTAQGAAGRSGVVLALDKAAHGQGG